MIIRTIHRSVHIHKNAWPGCKGGTINFKSAYVEGAARPMFELEVPDHVGNYLLSVAHNDDYAIAAAPAVDPAAEEASHEELLAEQQLEDSRSEEDKQIEDPLKGSDDSDDSGFQQDGENEQTEEQPKRSSRRGNRGA